MGKSKDNLAVVRSVEEMRDMVRAWRSSGDRIVLVPTMGALHEGHLALMRLGQERADRLVVSIFVNPTQFGPNEDLDAYPRNEEADLAKLREVGADLAFCPTAEEMYPEGFVTRVEVAGLTGMLCGASRAGHFDGVATVVSKLLLQCGPDMAIFGEKDYQQLLIIRRMVSDLNIPVEILGGATVREADGLALSSRNAYLTPDDRARAPLLHQTMQEMRRVILSGKNVADAIATGRKVLEEAGFAIDYLDVRDAGNLTPVDERPEAPARIFAAAILGKTRLIDNIAINED